MTEKLFKKFFLLFSLISLSHLWAQGSFTHGVASGDPGQESVVLWTRYVNEDSSASSLIYEVAETDDFTSVISSGEVLASPDHDFCAKVVAEGLAAGQGYFYRFKVGSQTSPMGRTKTLPNEVDHINIGVVNCAKYTGGYYHAFDALANMDDIDVVIHLGDYIYESGPSTPSSSYWQAYQATGRQHNPMHACISLKDYRTRYAQYRSDTALQKLHARYPMIPIWDDHEIAMKKHMNVVDEDDDPLGKAKKVPNPEWEKRRDNSIIAYHEWLPLRPKAFETIYRSFQFGDLTNLMMLDTRVCCRGEVDKTAASLKDTSRHIIGNAQLQWIKDEVLEHDAAWNVFGNQILISLKGKGWNRWQGFPYDRDRFLDFVEGNPKKNFVFTTGNAHNPHHYLVFDESGKDTLLHELLPGSISSGNNAEKARFDPAILAKEEKRLNAAKNVAWFNQNAHGFIVLDISRESFLAQWYFVSTIWKPKYEVLKPYSYKIKSKK